jgi:hypothetical protein
MTTPKNFGSRVKYTVAIVVSSVWAFNVTAGAFIHGYEISQTVNAVMLAVVGGLFGTGILSGHKKPPDDKDDEK